MHQLKSYNNGFRYILNVIDVFSKFVCSVPIKDKQVKQLPIHFNPLLKLVRGNLKYCGLIMDLIFKTTYLKNGWLRMKLKCIVHLMKVRPLLLKDFIVH